MVSGWLFLSDRFRIVHTQDKGNAMPKERAREGDVFEERVQLFEAIDRVSSEAIDRVSSALYQLRSVLDGRRGH